MALTLCLPKGTLTARAARDMMLPGQAVTAGGAYVTTEAQRARALEQAPAYVSVPRLTAEILARAAEPVVAARRRAVPPLVQMCEDGYLQPIQLRAGQEIERVFVATTAGMGGRVTASYGERLDAGPDGAPTPASLEAAYRRYVGWSGWAGAKAVTARVSLRDLTLHIALDHLGLYQVAAKLRMDGRTVRARLQVSLMQYCTMAGWCTEEKNG